jgi:hypothetical protein
MAIRADDLTEGYFGSDPLECVALVYQRGDPGRLLTNVIELQDKRVCKPAVGATRRGQQAQNVLPCHCPSAFPGRAGLPAVQLPALAHVVRPAPFARRLARMEVGQRQVFIATSTAPHLDRAGWWLRLRHGCRGRRADASSPCACRAERDSKLACDPAHRPPLRAQSSGLTLLTGLPDRHTNICSVIGRT